MKNALLQGLPEFCEYAVQLAKRRKLKGPVVMLVYHHLGDVAQAARHALFHYLPINLDQPYSQKSSIGTPYQKWAYFTNEDFHRLDGCVRRLSLAVYAYYAATNDTMGTEGPTLKDAAGWFRKVLTDYICCSVDSDAPKLSLSVLHMDSWVQPDGGRFNSVTNRFDRVNPTPPVVTKQTVEIQDRGVVTSLCKQGKQHLEAIERSRASLAALVRETYTVSDLLEDHAGIYPNEFLCQ